MSKTMRRFLPGGLGGLTGLACALCCAIPLLLAVGVLGGAGWAFVGQILPGVAVALAAATASAWWWAKRRPAHAAGGDGKTDLALFRPSEGKLYVLPSVGGAEQIHTYAHGDGVPTPQPTNPEPG